MEREQGERAKEMKIVINGKSYQISNPVEIIKVFCVLDPSYKNYDLGEINVDDSDWLEKCIDLANRGMRARIFTEKSKKRNNQKDEILKLKDDIEKLIKKANISPESSILDTDLDKLKDLFECIRQKGIQNAKITKILHKKFLNLIPIVDKLIGEVYMNKKYDNKSVEHLIDVTKKIRENIEKNVEFLAKIKLELSATGINLSELRIFDILIWIFAQEKDSRIKGLLFKKGEE